MRIGPSIECRRCAGAGGLHQRVLQVAQEDSVAAHNGGPTIAKDDSYGPPELAWDVRCPTDLHAELKERGVAVGRKRVARLMRQAAIVGGSRRRWAADITYVATWSGFLYLADRHGRLEPQDRRMGAARVAARSVGPRCSADGGRASLRPGLAVHVDRVRPALCRG